MFPQCIVLLSALALAGAAIVDLEKREVFDGGDDVDQNVSIFWDYSKCCNICRDPDVLTYDLRRIRVRLPCMYNLTADVDKIVQVFILTKPTGFSKRSFVARVDIVYNDVNYSFAKGECKERFFMTPPGGYQNIEYENDDVRIYIYEIDYQLWMIFRIKAVYFEVRWDCHSCVIVCVGRRFDNIMEGLCGNNNNDPADDDWNQGSDDDIARYWQYYNCTPNGGYVV